MASHHTVIIAILICAALVCCALSFTAGLRFEYRRSIDYKSRWQESVKTLESVMEGGEAKKEIPPPKKVQGHITLDQGTLNQLLWWDRRDLEIKRAKEGKLPIDNLKGLPDFAKGAVIKARIQYGTQQ